MAMGNAAWFEIPSADFERAVKFYEAIFVLAMKRERIAGMTLGIFPGGETDITGAVLFDPDLKPSHNGATIYLSAGDDLSTPLARVEKAGGKIMVPKTALPPGMGHFAVFLDSEGNRMGLFSMG